MKEIILPQGYNYIAVFLTLKCNLNCSYCINSFGKLIHEEVRLSGREWVEVLNRIATRDDLPITLQGGEPSLHKDFEFIIENLKPELPVDILTNLQFDIGKFISKIKPARLKRKAPYASLRVSFHPETMDLKSTFEKVLRLQEANFSVGVWAVMHPQFVDKIKAAHDCFREKGIDFRTKEFLGIQNNKLLGTYKYIGACEKKNNISCKCKTSELILGPDAKVYRCHSDLYEGRVCVGDLRDKEFSIKDEYIVCDNFGSCNPCDIKIKTNRFQEQGHTSVDIRL